MITFKVIAHYNKKMNKHEEQEVFDFFTDNLAKASQEFQNKVKESNIYNKIQEELNKYIRIPLAEYGTDEWFKQNGWELNKDDVHVKNGYYLAGPSLVVESVKGHLYLISEYFGKLKQVVFLGYLNNEEDFLTIERLIGI